MIPMVLWAASAPCCSVKLPKVALDRSDPCDIYTYCLGDRTFTMPKPESRCEPSNQKTATHSPPLIVSV